MRLKSLPRKIALIALGVLPLAACGNKTEALCTDSEVLKTLQKLVEQDEFGAGAQLLPDIFSIRSGSATYVSTDSQRGTVRCSAIAVSDQLKLMGFGRSEEDIAKLKVEAPKHGVPLTKEHVVHFTVQSMANDQVYVTLVK